MSAWLWVVAGLVSWLATIAFGLILCIAGKRDDEATERAAGPQTPEEPPTGRTGRVVRSQAAFLGRRQR